MSRWIWFLGIVAAVTLTVASRSSYAADSPGADTYQPPSVDEAMSEDSSTGQLNNWRPHGDGGYNAQQIVNDARLAHQFTNGSKLADGELMPSGVGIKKHHQLNPAIIVAIAVGGVIVLLTVVLLIWSRIVSYREMRDSPGTFQISGPPRQMGQSRK